MSFTFVIDNKSRIPAFSKKVLEYINKAFRITFSEHVRVLEMHYSGLFMTVLLTAWAPAASSAPSIATPTTVPIFVPTIPVFSISTKKGLDESGKPGSTQDIQGEPAIGHKLRWPFQWGVPQSAWE